MPDLSEGLALLVFILNILPLSLGTLVSALEDKKGFNRWALTVWTV